MTKNTQNDLFSDSQIFLNYCELSEPTDYHCHNFIEIAFVASGTGLHQIAGYSMPAQAGDIFVIYPGVFHQFSPHPEGLAVYNCVIAPSLFSGEDPFFRSLKVCENFLHVSFDSFHYPEIFRLYNQMLEEYHGRGFGWQEILKGCLLLLQTLILRQEKQPQGLSSLSMETALQYISRHYTETITAQTLADLSHLSRSDFFRKFKQATGKTLTQYIQTLRVQYARHLLLHTDKKVLEIAGLCGYSDSKHFYQVFKRITGKVPSDYRK